MVTETLADLRSLFSQHDNAIRCVLSNGAEVIGIFDRNFDQALDVNGRRTTLRVVNEDSADIAIDSTITLKEEKTVFTVRDKEQGSRTTVLILEKTS